MKEVKVVLELINDYADGKRNGELKTIDYSIIDGESMEETKENIENDYELNLDDMWQIKEII